MNDTSPEVLRLQMEFHRRMTSGERLRVAAELSELARGLALASLRAEHPDLDDRAVISLWVRRLHGVELPGPA